MQKYSLPAILAISAIMVGSGIFTTMGVLGPQNQATTEGTNIGESPGLMGHVILEAKDSQGHIKAYRQTDNLIFNGGANCIAKLVFGSNGTNSLPGCTSANLFHYLAVGTNGTTPVVGSRNFASFLTELTGTSRVDAAGTNLGVTNSTGSGAAAAAVSSIGNTVTIGATGGSVTTVGLADSATSNAGDLFSRVQLGSAIAVNPADTIKVTWYISISH